MKPEQFIRLADTDGSFFDSRLQISLARDSTVPLPPMAYLRGTMTEKWIKSGRLIVSQIGMPSTPEPVQQVETVEELSPQTRIATRINELVSAHSTAKLLKMCAELGIAAKKKDKKFLATKIAEWEIPA